MSKRKNNKMLKKIANCYDERLQKVVFNIARRESLKCDCELDIHTYIDEDSITYQITRTDNYKSYWLKIIYKDGEYVEILRKADREKLGKTTRKLNIKRS